VDRKLPYILENVTLPENESGKSLNIKKRIEFQLSLADAFHL
jgi:hypothetical protein